MRAVRYHEGGGPSVLQLEEVDRPTAGAGEVLVDVRAASANPVDAKRRAAGGGPLPKTSGSDFAGVVEAVGPDVSAFAPGDRVCGTGLHTSRFEGGSFADAVVAPTDVLTPLPDGVGFEEGAAVALVGVTAWLGLLEYGGLAPTDRCLVHGGTGGVGHVAVQLAAAVGAHTVTTASPDRTRTAEAFGADAAVDYARGDLLETVRSRATDGYDVIFDHRAGEYFTFDLEAAAFDGTVVLYGGLDGEVELAHAALSKGLTVEVMSMSNLATAPDFPTIAGVLRRVLELVDDGTIAPEIARRYELAEASEAHRAVMEDSFVGKLLVVP